MCSKQPTRRFHPCPPDHQLAGQANRVLYKTSLCAKQSVVVAMPPLLFASQKGKGNVAFMHGAKALLQRWAMAPGVVSHFPGTESPARRDRPFAAHVSHRCVQEACLGKMSVPEFSSRSRRCTENDGDHQSPDCR